MVPSTRALVPFLLKNRRVAVLNFPLKINKNSHKQNLGRITNVTIPLDFNNTEKDPNTFFKSLGAIQSCKI